MGIMETTPNSRLWISYTRQYKCNWGAKSWDNDPTPSVTSSATPDDVTSCDAIYQSYELFMVLTQLCEISEMSVVGYSYPCRGVYATIMRPNSTLHGVISEKALIFISPLYYTSCFQLLTLLTSEENCIQWNRIKCSFHSMLYSLRTWKHH
jgi:hypothetical protein